MKMLSTIFISILSVLTVSAATFTVMNTNDSGVGSFRQAILDSNTNAATNTITFSIPETGLRVIKLLSGLPLIVQPVTIDGFTQPGATENTLSNGNNANWIIELDGTAAGSNRNGLDLLPGTSAFADCALQTFPVTALTSAATIALLRAVSFTVTALAVFNWTKLISV
jgi:hypothetical protein